MPKRFNAVGCYIFAGGFTLGVQKYFNILGHLEDGNYGVETAKANIKSLEVEINPDRWMDFCDGKRTDFMYCNPPCAIFSIAGSKSNKGMGWKNDKRTNCWYNILNLACEVQPKVLAVESVTQILKKGDSLLREAIRTLSPIYKRFHLVLIDTLSMGLPQSRKRLFFIASNIELGFKRDKDVPRGVTVGEVLAAVDSSGFIYPRKNDMQYVSETRQGEKLKDVYHRRHKIIKRGSNGQVIGRPGFLVRRLKNDSPMGAFTGNDFVHPTEDRFLGLNEMKAICGYPKNFELLGTKSTNPKLLAQAVMPAAGKWLAEAVSDSLRKNVRGGEGVWLIDLRKENNPPKNVTDQYATH